jgi:hypothetical protein
MENAIIERVDLYDEMGFPITNPYIEEGYDINGFPATRVVGAIIDGKVIRAS